MQVEPVDDRPGTKVEDVEHGTTEPIIGDDTRSVAIDIDRERGGTADRVGDLHLYLAGEPGGDDVLGDVTGHVRTGAIDLCRILPGEGSTTV